MLKMSKRDGPALNWMPVRLFDPGTVSWAQLLVSRLALTRITERMGLLRDKQQEGYVTLLSFMAFVFPYPSMYGSCNNKRS